MVGQVDVLTLYIHTYCRISLLSATHSVKAMFFAKEDCNRTTFSHPGVLTKMCVKCGLQYGCETSQPLHAKDQWLPV